MSRKILVVEDEEDILLTVRLSLETEDQEVLEARDGLEALELIQQQDPDLVILDLRLPRMDGFEVLERLAGQSRAGNPPVLVLSAHASPGTLKRAEQLGCKGYVTKPFSTQELLAGVRRALRD